MTSLRGRPFWRVVCLLTLHVLTTASIAAQTRSEEEQRRLEAIRVGLRSDDPRRVAWAAFDATADQRAAVREDIAAAVERFESTADANATPLPWLLDAAVQTKAPVSAARLPAFWKHWPVQTALLFPYAKGNRDEILVRLLTESQGAAWFAAANLLLGHRVDGFAPNLVQHVRFHVTVYVTDVPNVVFGDAIGMGTGSTIGWQEPGFPSFPLYRFVPPYHAAARVLLDGPRTVYYQRDVRDGGWDEYGVNPPTNDEISKYLASITKAAVGLTPLPEKAQRTVLWVNAGQFQTEIDSMRNPLLRTYEQLVRALVAAGVITPADAPGPDRAVTVQFEDHRRDRSAPLPSVPSPAQ